MLLTTFLFWALLGMASVRRKPGSKYFYACYTAADGTQQQKSTKSTDRKTAQKIADALEEGYQQKTTSTKLRKSFSKLSEDIGAKLNLATTVRQFFERWLLEIEGEPGPGTYARYQQIVRDSLTDLGTAADLPLDEVERHHFVQLRKQVADRTSPRNANIYTKVWRRIWRAAVDDDLCERDPVRKIKLLAIPDGDRIDRRPFSDDELRRLKAVLTGEWHLIVMFGEYTGQRLGDIACCSWQQLDLDGRIWAFTSQKTNRKMRVPLVPALVEAIKNLGAAGKTGPLFPLASATKRGADGESRKLSAQFRRFMEKAGIVPKRSKRNTGRGHGRKRRTSELCFHSLRHNATSNLRNAGVAEAVVMDIIGHESEPISRGYTHIPDAIKLAEVEKVHLHQKPGTKETQPTASETPLKEKEA